MDDTHSTDVLIAGGGFVGLALGLALDQAGLGAVVIDAAPPDRQIDDRFDGRASALSPGSVALLGALGVWPLVAEAQPVGDIVVSEGTVGGGATPFFLHFDGAGAGGALFHMVENRHLRHALRARATGCTSLRVLAPARIADLQVEAGGVLARLDDGRAVRAALAVGAEGRASPTREGAGIKSVAWTYDQAGLVTTVAHERPHEGIAQEYFLPAGPFAILPLTGNRASLVWTERTRDAERILALPDAAFTAELRARFTDYLGEVAPIGPRWSYPLHFHAARTFIAPRVALAGDAAHVIHPLAGQGLNLGLKDVAALAEVLAGAVRLGLDPGAPDVLERYQGWRRFDTAAHGALTDLLNALFSNENPVLGAIRGRGLALVDRFAPLKRMLVGAARAGAGPQPRLLRGEPV